MSNKLSQEYRKRKAELVRLLRLYKKKKAKAQKLLAKLKKKVIGINKLELKDHARKLVRLYKKLIVVCREKLFLLENTLHEETKKLHLKINPTFAVVSAFLLLGVFLFLNDSTLTGLVVSDVPENKLAISPVQIEFTSNDFYVWTKNWTGNLSSMKISGKFIGTGSAKLYLGDQLILDSDKLTRPEVLSNDIAAISAQMALQLQNLQNGNSTSANVTNETEEVEISFSDACEETCSLDLNNEVYQIKAQVENAKIVIDSITYTTVEKFEEIVPEIVDVTLPLNLTQPEVNVTNVTTITPIEITNISEGNITQVKIRKDRKHFKTEETPSFDFEYDDKDLIPITVRKGQEFAVGQERVKTILIDGNGRISSIKTDIIKTASKRFRIDIPKQREFKPGRYSLKIENFVDENTTYIEEYDFTWGVLALNTHKAIYLPNEKANIGIGVLDDAGHMVCDDAKVTLSITDPFNLTTTLSTANGKIKVSDECKYYKATKLPDYYTDYLTGSTGTYLMNLTAVTSNGIRSIIDSFEVRSAVDFDVARDGPTRTYPPATYSMNFTIKANKNFNGKIKEFVPIDFEVLPQSDLKVSTLSNEKELTWDTKIKTGDIVSLGYNFRTGQESPYLYLLGPLEIGNFKEIRDWMIASDAPFNYSIAENFGGTTGADRIANWSVEQFNASITYLNSTVRVLDNVSACGCTTRFDMNSGPEANGEGSMTFNVTFDSTDDTRKYGYVVNYSKLNANGLVSINGSSNNDGAGGRSHNISFRINQSQSTLGQATALGICVRMTGTFCAVSNRVLYVCAMAKGNMTGLTGVAAVNPNYDRPNIKFNQSVATISIGALGVAVNRSIVSIIQAPDMWGSGCKDYNITRLQWVVQVGVGGASADRINRFNVDELLISNETQPAANNPPVANTAVINYTNATLSKSGITINASVSIQDVDGNPVSGTAALFVNNTYKNYISIEQVQTAPGAGTGSNLSIIFNATNITKGSEVYVEWNVTDGTDYSDPVNSSIITVNDSNLTLASAAINYTNLTLNFSGDFINASVSVTDPDKYDLVNTTVKLFINRAAVANQTLHIINSNTSTGTRTISIIFNNTNITKGQVLEMQFNGTSDSNTVNAFYINATAVTVNDTNPFLSAGAINYTNLTLNFSGDFINASVNMADADNEAVYTTAILFVNRVPNLTLQIDSFTTTAAGRSVSIVFNNTNITKNQVVTLQFNGTSTGNSNDGTYHNATDITVNDTNPVLSAGAINYTNITLSKSGEQINASITVSDVDNEAVYTTATLFVDRVQNISLQIGSFTISPSGRIVSIVFNNTNITKSQVIGVQFNSTSTGNSNDATYANGTEVTVNDSSPVYSAASLNYTNATLVRSGEQINTSVTVADADADQVYTTAILFVNRVTNLTQQIPLTSTTPSGRIISIVFNATNVSKWDNLTVQFNGTSDTNTNLNTYVNATFVTVNDTAPVFSAASINYTNATFVRTGEDINVSATLSDADSENNYITATLLVNRTSNISLQVGTVNIPTAGRTVSIIFNDTNITRGQSISVQFNSTSTGNAVDGTYFNATEITVNDTAPSLASATTNYTNATLTFTGEQINVSVTISDADSVGTLLDDVYTTAILFVNRTSNLTQQISNTIVPAAGRIVSIVFNATNITKGQAIGIQFNGTSDGNSLNSVYTNATEITVNDTAPALSNAAINYTNATLTISGETINASVTITDSDPTDSVYTTAILFVNRVRNISLDIGSFNIPSGGRTLSIIFNNTNITSNDVLTMQFNSTSTGDSSDAIYTNATAVTVTTANTGPYIGNISVRDTLTITENSLVAINISFLVFDNEGTADINGNYTRLNITNNGTTTALRLNNSCSSTAINAFVLNVTCPVDIWYFDVPGTWNITIEVKDLSNVVNVSNRSHNAAGISKDFFTIADTTAVIVGPSSLTFPAVVPGADNTTADTNITINNTGNHNSTQGNLALTAVNLRGQSLPDYIIPAANFTVNTSSGGSPLVQCNVNTTLAFTNNTLVTITNATLGPGNRSAGSMEGVEAFFICLYDTPDNLTGQVYSATGVNSWTITVN